MDIGLWLLQPEIREQEQSKYKLRQGQDQQADRRQKSTSGQAVESSSGLANVPGWTSETRVSVLTYPRSTLFDSWLL